jgi:hypothetical protein
LTIDEELTKLEENIRRLKIEYDAYFSGGAPRAPHDTLYRVEQTIKKFASEGGKHNFSQRCRFNSLAQKYAVHSELWRKKLREKEEGRGQFGVHRRPVEAASKAGPTRITCMDPEREREKVDQLLGALIEAKRSVGERVDNVDPMTFQKFVRDKTKQLKDSLGCKTVQFSVTVEEGKVKFTAVKGD